MSNHQAEHAHVAMAPETGRHVVFEQAVRELLIEKGAITEAQVRQFLDLIDSRTPMLGASLAARAWLDADFKTLLLTDAKAALWKHAAIELSHGPELVVLENTETVHHVIVCTLCSCYPKAVLGLPPDWYKSFQYRSRMVVEPRAILAKFGTILSDDVEIRVVDSTADLRYMVLPRRPQGTDTMTVEDLTGLISRDHLIGVAVPDLTLPRRA